MAAAKEQYSRVSRRMWRDETFLSLSKPLPSARELWVYLLTGPRCTSLPGLIAVGPLGLAEDLDWAPGVTTALLDELAEKRLIQFDPRAKLLWLPNALQHNLPTGANVVIGWEKPWRMLPECALRTKAAAAIRKTLRDFETSAKTTRGGLSAAWSVVVGDVDLASSGVRSGRIPRAKSVADEEKGIPKGSGTGSDNPSETCSAADEEKGIPKGSGTGSDNPSEIQDPDQDQDQDLSPSEARVPSPMPEPAPPPLPPPAVALPGYAEAILAELQRYPVCISTGVATAEAAQDLALGAFAAGEAVDGAVASIQAWGTVEGASARHDGASGGEILKRIGGFIRSGRNRRLRTPVEQRPGLQRPLDPEADLLALEVGKLWRSARHDLRREYGEVLEDGVEQRYAWLAGKAYAAARERSTTTAEPPVGLAFAAVKHWLRVYLRNDARFLVEAKHPLRLLRELEGLPWDASVRRERERPAPDGPGPDDVGPDLTEAILGLAKSGPLLPRRKTS